MFPLLGTEPGKQVYLEWGPGNRTVATALPLGEVGEEGRPDIATTGYRPEVPRPPDVAVAAVGAISRRSASPGSPW